MQSFIDENYCLLAHFGERVGARGKIGLRDAFRLRDLLIAQICYLHAMLDYCNAGGKSRGSAIYTGSGGECPRGLEQYGFARDGGEKDGEVQEITFTENGCGTRFRPVRPLPQGGGFFENVWRQYRENKNIY